MNGEPDNQVFSQFRLLAGLGQGFSPGLDYFHGGAASGCPAANHALNAVFDHEVHGPLAGADQGLVAFHRQVLGSGNKGNFFQVIAPVGHVRRDVVVLAVVGEGAFVEGLEHDLNLFLEELPVGILVYNRRIEGLYFTAVIATAHTKYHAAVGQDIGSGIVLGQAQGIPHGGYIEAASNFQLFGKVGQVDGKQQQVGDTLVAFPLEMVLGHPESLVIMAVHNLGNGFCLVEYGRQVLVGKPAVI